jgi:biotin carboxyl carrier protein
LEAVAAEADRERDVRVRLPEVPVPSEAGAELGSAADANVAQLARHTAAIIELTTQISATADIDTACQHLVTRLNSHLGADLTAIALVSAAQGECQLQAVSDADTVDRLNPATQNIEAALQESVARAEVSVWPPMEGYGRHALLAHRQFADSRDSRAVITAPVRDSQDQIVAALLLSFDAVNQHLKTDRHEQLQQVIAFLAAAERPLAATLGLLIRSSKGIVQTFRESIQSAFGMRRARTVTALILFAGMILLIPAEYNIRCDLELQPVARRYVAAPFDGPLLESVARPGDVVEKDQLLARMDDREIKWELAGLRADLNRANNERNSFLSQHKVSDAEIARHEVQRLKNREQLLEHRSSHLEIRSPIAGVVVSGDHRNAEGVPLDTGQTLFEIAPLDRMIVEVAIPEDDISQAQQNQRVSIRLNAMPDAAVEATILRIHPRSQVRDGDNVFIAEAEIDNSGQHLRPGMQGEATISTGKHCLGWNLFHKPLAHLMGWLGW